MNFFGFLTDNMKSVFMELRHHIVLAILPTLSAIIIGIGFGIVISKFKKNKAIVESLENILRTLPLICTFALMIYFFGVGYFSTAIIIFIYSIFPIAKQTYLGIDRITPKKLKAIKKMGLNNWQVFSLVRVPTCLPYIIGGFRISLINAIAMVTLAAYFGSGGLGVYIFRGIAVDDINSILVGTVFIILTGLIINFALLGLQALITARGLIRESNDSGGEVK